MPKLGQCRHAADTDVCVGCVLRASGSKDARSTVQVPTCNPPQIALLVMSLIEDLKSHAI